MIPTPGPTRQVVLRPTHEPVRRQVAAAAVLAATACGAPAPPGELVPALRTELTQVDQAIIAEDYTQARDDLDAIAAQTATARDEGRITPHQADRILAAI